MLELICRVCGTIPSSVQHFLSKRSIRALQNDELTKNQEPRKSNQKPRIKKKEPRTKNKESRTKNQEPRARSQEPKTKNQETKNQEPRTRQQGPRTKRKEARSKRLETYHHEQSESMNASSETKATSIAPMLAATASPCVVLMVLRGSCVVLMLLQADAWCSCCYKGQLLGADVVTCVVSR